MIIKRGKYWLLLSRQTGKILGRHKTKDRAEKQEKAIQIAVTKRNR